MSDSFPFPPDQEEDYAYGDFSTPASTAPQFVVKNRSSSGCLIVRKRGNDGTGGLGSSGSGNVYGSKKAKKRAKMNMSDSGSSDELLRPLRRRVAPETIQVCNHLSHFDMGSAEENDIGRKRIRGEGVNEADVIHRGGEVFSERKRNRLDVFEFDEYDGSDKEIRRKPFDDSAMEGRRYFSPIAVGRNGLEREYETGSSRHHAVDRRNSSYSERIKGVGDHGDRDRKPIPFYGDKNDSDGHIRVQGKNGVLKVMVNNRRKVSGPLNSYDSLEVEGKGNGSRSEVRPSFYTEPKISEKARPSVSEPKYQNKLKSSSAKRLPIRNGKIKDQDSKDGRKSIKLGPLNVENISSRKAPLSTRSLKGQEVHSEDSDTSLKLGPKNVEACEFTKRASSGGEIVPGNEETPARSKEGKIKRGTGTEKQKLRERIREMLLNAGWTIDYRPRRNRDYLDAVYINPTGTAYWSIIKAYDALLKQSNEEEEEAKAKGDVSFRPLSDEVLSQLTRKTRKKMEKEIKKKQRDSNESENVRETGARSSSLRHDEESIDNDSHEEKLSSFIKQSGSGKLMKRRMKGNSSLNPNMRGQSAAHHPKTSTEPSGVDSGQGRKNRKLSRCTLLVRNSNERVNSDSDGYVPYSGKRTVLSWLIDCGAVQLSQKVHYMNRRRTKVMLDGWVTRDGIHCGCCSKILTVFKFEIHAGSKQRFPYQNIYLDSGVSLLECQIDAWNRQESSGLVGFHSVHVDGDDPNDDTCGLCGDGGDLICCDNCPSTFHLSCLDIEMLPRGDWHCPHCTCTFCGLASEEIIQDSDATVGGLFTCNLCAKRYHKSCSQGVDALSSDTNGSTPCFCGKICKEVFEQLEKYLGVKHELESGFSWCLIRRTDVDSDTSIQGLPQRVECNSKLAVALSVMDECFLPIVDRRSGINLLHNVLYNCGSNFNRLNYSGFYTAILERGDEIISAASIRLHGTQLAEMPFIGTRHIYRRQGMCRRLFCAIESALYSMKVQMMIIPAISELTDTWTGVFGFSNVDRSLKQELKSVNMLVFPGVDLLQKQLLEQDNTGGNRTIATGVRGTEFKDNQCIASEATIRSDIDSSAKNDPDECDDGDLEHASRASDEVSTRSTYPPCMDVPLNDTSLSSPLDSSNENINSVPLHGTVNTDIYPAEIKRLCIADKMSNVSKSSFPADSQRCPLDSSTENKTSLPREEFVNTDDNPVEIRSPYMTDEMDNISGSSSPVENNIHSTIQDHTSPTNSGLPEPCFSVDDSLVMNGSSDPFSEQKNAVFINRTAICADMESGSNLAELTSDSKILASADLGGERLEEDKQEVSFPVKEDGVHFYKEGAIEDANKLNLNESAFEELKMLKSIEIDVEFVKIDAEGKYSLNSDTFVDSVMMEATPAVDLVSQDKPRFGEEDAGKVNTDMPCPEAVSSRKEKDVDNSAKSVDQIESINGAGESSIHTNFDQDQITCETEAN